VRDVDHQAPPADVRVVQEPERCLRSVSGAQGDEAKAAHATVGTGWQMDARNWTNTELS
jgi:hypothetical protein